MPDEPRPVEHSTEPTMLPMETAPVAEPLDLGRDEAEETGTVENDEVEELINPKRKSDDAPPVPPPPPVPVHVTTSEPAPWLWWVTLGLCTVAIAVGVLYVVKARQREAPSRTDRTDGSRAPAPEPAAE